MKVMPTIGFTLFISVFFAVGFGILGYALYTLRASKVAGTWPTTQGKVLRCEIKEGSDSDGGRTYETKVEYSYTVAGSNYKGTRIAFGYSGSSGRKAHQEIADRLTGVKTVTVRYDPGDASKAVLSYGINRSTVVMLIFGATWTLFVTGFTVLWIMMSRSDTGVLSTLVTTR